MLRIRTGGAVIGIVSKHVQIRNYTTLLELRKIHQTVESPLVKSIVESMLSKTKSLKNRKKIVGSSDSKC